MQHRLRIDGLSFNVLDEGAGEPVLLVHGFPDDHTVWRHQVAALVAAGYRVIAPDNRGCGETDMAARTRDYLLPRLVADLVGVLDALGIARVKLVGHDWGAVIAWAFAARHPERVERYAALSVGHAAAYAAGQQRHRERGASQVARAPLTGRLFDLDGEPLTPSFSRGKSGRVYRYYVSASLQQGRASTEPTTVRVSASKLEKLLAAAVSRVTGAEDPLTLVKRAALGADRIEVTIPVMRLRDMRAALEPGEELEQQGPDEAVLLLPVRLGMKGSSIEPGASRLRDPEPDRVLITALRKAHRMLVWESCRPVIQEAPKSPYERSLLRLALLAPDLQRDILAGRQPAWINLERLMKSPIPLDWQAQRRLFGLT